MVREQRTIEEFGRVRLGKPETVSKHTRTYDIKPEIDKKTKEKILHGKAKRINTKITEFEKKPIQIQVDLYSKPTNDAFTKEFNKTMLEIVELSEFGKYDVEINKRLSKNETEFQRKMGGWRVKNEERIKPDPDVTKYKEIQAGEIFPREIKLKGDKWQEKETDPIERLKLKKEIAHYQKEVEKLHEKIKNKPFYKKYHKNRAEDLQKLKDVRKQNEGFYDFLDNVNEEFEEIKKEENFAQLVLNDNLEFNIKKNEKHYSKIKLNGKEEDVCFPVKHYTFEELNPNHKRKIIKIIKKEFVKNYGPKTKND